MIDRIGKDISGLGMDSNVVGRYYTGPTGVPPAIQRIVVRDLTDETEGNAVGIGMADVVVRRAVDADGSGLDLHELHHGEDARGRADRPDGRHRPPGDRRGDRVLPERGGADGPDRPDPRHEASRLVLRRATPCCPSCAPTPGCEVMAEPAAIGFDSGGALTDPWPS